MITKNISNKFVCAFLITFTFSLLPVSAQNDTMYVLKSGVVVGKFNVIDQVDSVIFYKPTTGSSTTVTDLDSNVYKTVTIGTQTWMAENLAYLPSVVSPATGSQTTPYHYVYGYNGTSVTDAKATTNYQTYGVLYNWPAALSACPVGWHLPTDEEWTTLQNYLIANGYNYDGTTTGNRIAKSLATASGWISHTGAGSVGNTDFPEKRNATGFSALPGGYRDYNGSFYGSGSHGYWWSATEYGSTYAKIKDLGYSYSSLSRYGSYKVYGASVRCLRD